MFLFLSATTLNAQITKQSSEIKKDQSSTTKKESKEIKTHSINVKFHCANGKALIERELVKKEGVISASANLETKAVEIKYNPKLVTEEKLVEYIHEIGYLVEGDPADTKLPKKACSH